MAWGRFVAPSVKTPSLGPPEAPSRQLRKVERTRASAPPAEPALARSQTSASISSKKRMQGAAASAAAKAARTVASASPR